MQGYDQCCNGNVWLLLACRCCAASHHAACLDITHCTNVCLVITKNSAGIWMYCCEHAIQISLYCLSRQHALQHKTLNYYHSSRARGINESTQGEGRCCKQGQRCWKSAGWLQVQDKASQAHSGVQHHLTPALLENTFD